MLVHASEFSSEGASSSQSCSPPSLNPQSTGVCRTWRLFTFPRNRSFCPKPQLVIPVLLSMPSRERYDIISPPHRAAFKDPFQWSPLLRPGSRARAQPAFSQLVTLPGRPCSAFSRAKPSRHAPERRSETTHRGQVTFLSSYRPNFHASQNHSFPCCQKTSGFGGATLVLIQGVIF